MKKFLKWTGIVLGSLIGLVLLAGFVLYPIGMEKLTRSYPDVQVETIAIPSGSEAIARGRHISIVWACTRCHGADLSGTVITNDPMEGTIPLLGTIPASNLTSGKGGIGESYTDTDWIRAIRHGVMQDGEVEIFMYDYSTMTDQDLGDLIAYLKQIPPVDTDYPEMSYGPIIPIVPAVGLFTPAAELINHDAQRPEDPAPAATKEYGRYLSAICAGCHGSSVARALGKWNQDEFTRTLQTGVRPDGIKLGPTMSSETFREMNDVELSALWLYLQGLPQAKSQK